MENQKKSIKFLQEAYEIINLPVDVLKRSRLSVCWANGVLNTFSGYAYSVDFSLFSAQEMEVYMDAADEMLEILLSEIEKE